jgi:2-oxoglutarate dehydrogenase E2 component (dihydrolipoamide succinyltransferase)
MIFEIRLPALGEGITDATLIRWLKNEGDLIEKDSPVAEIATDKVDTEILAPGSGILSQILIPESSVVAIGEVIGIIATEKNEVIDVTVYNSKSYSEIENESRPKKNEKFAIVDSWDNTKKMRPLANQKYISPFIRTIALEEGLSSHELNSIPGTGDNERITKNDVLAFISNKKGNFKINQVIPKLNNKPADKVIPVNNEKEEYIELDRVRKMIAENMSLSKHTAPHVASFVEVNVTRLVNWRNKNKELFQRKYNFNLTYLPIIVEAAAKALRDFPKINASLTDNYLVLKKEINIGIATALPNGNLVVPVIKKATDKNWLALSKDINELAQKARSETLQLQDIQEGTFTVTNAGSFGNIGGTPIILQPQLAILAVGAFVKKPYAIKMGEDYGVSIQDTVELWLSYDHRVIDGYLGGSFLKKIAYYIEQFDDTIPV